MQYNGLTGADQDTGAQASAAASTQWPFLAAVQRWLLPIILATLVIPLIQLSCLGWLIWECTTHIPYGDEWDTDVVDAHRFASGTLRPGDLWAFNNEHRIPILRIIDVTIIELTHYNRQIEMTFGLIVGVGSVLLLLACVRRTLSVGHMVALIVPVSLLFSINQVDNWFWPDGIAVLLVDSERHTPVRGIYLCTDDVLNIPATYGLSRPDVASTLGSNGAIHDSAREDAPRTN